MKTPDPSVLKDLQREIEKRLRQQEISVVEYWKERLDRIAAMKPEGIAALQVEIKKLSDTMANRVRALKKD